MPKRHHRASGVPQQEKGGTTRDEQIVGMSQPTGGINTLIIARYLLCQLLPARPEPRLSALPLYAALSLAASPLCWVRGSARRTCRVEGLSCIVWRPEGSKNCPVLSGVCVILTVIVLHHTIPHQLCRCQVKDVHSS